MKTLAPIVLFCYNRPETLKHTVESLRENYWAEESELFIFSDGGKTPADEILVTRVRDYLKTITGFKKVVITESPVNKGLADSIIGGVHDIINKYEKVIVLEDDLVSSRNFIVYMNKALDYYKDNQKIYSITGFSIPIRGLTEDCIYYTQRANSCGWATWKDRWNEIDWEVRDYATLMGNRAARRAFNKMGSDMTGLLVKQKTGRINSWAIRWCYHQFKHNLFSVHPVLSKIKNIGYAKGATHTKEKFNRFETKLDEGLKMDFNFDRPVQLERKMIRQFTRPYSIPYRAVYKVLNILFASATVEELITVTAEVGR
jgi:cellulose synthase/poly-beta-1,6-N-acetylglucosamine synthase-like glycosyltransferase